jgi:hypothetical protein
MPYKRLDRVVAITTTMDLTEGKTYTILGVRKKQLYIATDKRKRKYLSMNFFIPYEQYFKRQEEEIRKKLEERGF